jgi:hypothetical protein
MYELPSVILFLSIPPGKLRHLLSKRPDLFHFFEYLFGILPIPELIRNSSVSIKKADTLPFTGNQETPGFVCSGCGKRQPEPFKTDEGICKDCWLERHGFNAGAYEPVSRKPK